MSKRNYKVDTKEMVRIRKQAEKTEKILEQIEKLKEQLYTIKENEKWLRYLGEESTITLTQEEKWELSDLFNKIMDSKI